MTLMVHPVLEAYLQQGWWKSRRRAWRRNSRSSSVESNSNLEFLEYHVYNALGEDITPD